MDQCNECQFNTICHCEIHQCKQTTSNMKPSDFINLKSAEALCVLIGLFLTFFLGKLWAIPTAAVYILLNVPALWTKIKKWYANVKKQQPGLE